MREAFLFKKAPYREPYKNVAESSKRLLEDPTLANAKELEDALQAFLAIAHADYRVDAGIALFKLYELKPLL